jgi:cytochrome c oxidase subunit 2
MPFAPASSGLLLLADSQAPFQSTLHPAGPAAQEIARLWWVMLILFTGVFVLVIVLLGYALRSSRRSVEAGTIPAPPTQPPDGSTRFIVFGGILLPVLVLTPLYAYSLISATRLRTPTEALTIRVVGHMWWWEVRYPDRGIVTANEIHIPVGQPVRLELASVDVIHSFWIPRLNGKRDMIPGAENAFWIQADEPGVYRGQCGEYCGTQHANMGLEVVALPPDAFEAWLAARSVPTSAPKTATIERGERVFVEAGCVQCHAIRGGRAAGNAGPDLTHLASRRMIGGAMLPNSRDAVASWIADPQTIKPGSKMPRTELTPDDLQVLLKYLGSLQ